MSHNGWDVFLPGEVVDLIIPDGRAIYETNWYRWFNKQDTNIELMQGMFPVTPKHQEQFLADAQASTSTRLLLLIWAKDAEQVVGVLSLSSIDFTMGRAEVAVVIGEKTGTPDSLYYGLEAKALLVQHGFETMGLKRIKSGQSFAHRNWQNIQVLFGFRPEGVEVNGFRKGLRVQDAVMTACNIEDYLRVKEKRHGAYWPGKARLYELMKKLPKDPLINEVRTAIANAVEEFESKIDWA